MIHQILIPFDFPADRRALLAQRGRVLQPTTSQAPLTHLLPDCDALIARTNLVINADLLRHAPRLRVIGVAGVGLDNVDLDAAAQLGIEVLHVPDAASDAVAEWAVGLMLQLIRPRARLVSEYRAGQFRGARANASGVELRELCVGILGLGRIGSRVGRICNHGFGARVLYNDIRSVPPPGFHATPVEKSELWRTADILSLHTPLTPLTRGLLSADVLNQLKPGAILINTARGAIVDTAALLAALQSGRLGGAGLDVLDPEPLSPDHDLFKLPNCLLTPHVAARTQGGLDRMLGVVERVLEFLDRTPPRTI